MKALFMHKYREAQAVGEKTPHVSVYMTRFFISI